jgi:peroxiredoxin
MAETLTRRRIMKAGVLLAGVVVAGPRARRADALEIGERAPDFELPATTGSKIKLSQFRGKQAVLIEFYGGDFAPV